MALGTPLDGEKCPLDHGSAAPAAVVGTSVTSAAAEPCPSGYPPSTLDLECILGDLRHAAKALAGLLEAFNHIDGFDIADAGWLADQAADLAEKAFAEHDAYHVANRSYLQRHGLIPRD